LVDLAQDAHLWILDAQYTPDEMAFHRAWGHSSHLEAAQLALEANAKIAALFHHDPDHDDKILDRMGHEAKSVVADSGTTLLMSRDGMVIDIEHSM
jgi:ribonuclease BN (tRNA processing enzyme)